MSSGRPFGKRRTTKTAVDNLASIARFIYTKATLPSGRFSQVFFLRSGKFAEQIRNQAECFFFISAISSSNNILTCSASSIPAAAARLEQDRFVFAGCGFYTPPIQVAAKCQA